MSNTSTEFIEGRISTYANAAAKEDLTAAATPTTSGDHECKHKILQHHQARGIPTITEDDLLKFQFQHFGDDTMPETFFVDKDIALKFQPWSKDWEGEVEEDDLGYYEDGTKRTLTDEQIELFRHTEVQQLLREATLRNDEFAQPDGDAVNDEIEHQPIPTPPPLPPPRSPAPSDSSIEDDLVGLARNRDRTNQRSPVARRTSSQSRSETTSHSTTTSKKRSKKHVPFEKRNKRKWEQYIGGQDEAHRSLTQRRMVRELDDRQEEQFDMDY